MSTATTPHFVQRDGGDFQRKQFQIAASQEAFRILSDGLYSRKIDAIIRELSTNAVDSHIVCGQKEPFEVHLPSMSEPWFAVKDYGTGLSHDDVMELYSTYFGTNKADDISTTGCLGLGSKSPLAKVRSFSVVSRHGGVERHYIVALNEDRIPEVNYLPEQDRPTIITGMEVKMAVDTSDVYDYASRAAEIYRYFPEHLRPRIVNGTGYAINVPEVLIEGQGWRLYKGSGTPMAVQGNVAYPIVASQIKGIESRHEQILSCYLEIDFDNGSLSFTPSREHLSYNKMTSEALVQRLDEIVNEVNDTVAQRFTNCRSLWEARTLAWTMFWSQNADLQHLRKLADTGSITWQGEKIAGQQLSFDHIPGVTGNSFEMRKHKRNYWSSDHKLVVNQRERNDYTPCENVVWVESDIPRGVYSRCQYYVREHEDAIVYLVSFADSNAKQAFCDKMGLLGDEFIPVSTLPKPPSNHVAGGKIHRSTSLVYRHKQLPGSSRLYQHWEAVEVDLDDEDGGVYVEMKNNKVVNAFGQRIDPQVVTEITRLIKETTGESIEVIGVRPQITKKFQKSDDWVDLWTYVKNLVKIHVTKHNLAQNVVNAEALHTLDNHTLWTSMMKVGDVPKTSAMYALFQAMTTMQASYKQCRRYNEWRTLCKHVLVDLNATPTYELQPLVDAVRKELPMLSVLLDVKVRHWQTDTLNPDELQALRHYLDLTFAKPVL